MIFLIVVIVWIIEKMKEFLIKIEQEEVLVWDKDDKFYFGLEILQGNLG